MDHGERAIVPMNFIMITGATLIWAACSPWWSTLIFAIPFSLFLAKFARDRYGGMQVVSLVSFGYFVATMGMLKRYRDASESHTAPDFGSMFLEFLATTIIAPILFFMFLSAICGLALTWEWGWSNIKRQRERANGNS